MKNHLLMALLLVLFAGSSGAADSSNSKTVAAAKKLFDSLDADQRRKLQFDAKDEEQRKRWSNLPTGIFKRAGLRMGDLTEPQRDAVWDLLQSALSPSGYEKIRQIVQADEVLKSGGGPRLNFGKDEYYVAFIGEPSPTDRWIIQFGGHHLALNVILVGDHGTLAPTHTGTQPAVYEFEGKTIRPLGRENDKAFALINALDESQRKQAILGAKMRDLVLGPGRDGPMIEPEGIKASSMTDKQREMLLDLASEWTAIQNASAASTKMADMKKHIQDTWFAWSGPTEKGSASYFRIQGPTVFIEYAPQTLGGDPTKHIHTIYRDPTNEYGAGFPK